MRSTLGVEPNPVSRALGSQGIKPFLILGYYCLPVFEFVPPRRHLLEKAARQSYHKSHDNFLHISSLSKTAPNRCRKFSATPAAAMAMRSTVQDKGLSLTFLSQTGNR